MSLNLILEPFVPQAFFKIGNLEIHYYAICIMLGMVLAALAAVPLFKRRGINPELLVDLMIAIVPCAIIGARAWYVICDIDQYWGSAEKFWGRFQVVDGKLSLQGGIFAIWEGGLAIHGGVALSALGVLIVCKIHKLRAGDVFDVCAAVLPLGQVLGRVGNYFNQEVYGFATNIRWFPVSVYIEKTGSYHLALFFYEMVLNAILFGLLYFFTYRYAGKRKFYTVSFYLLGYGVIRACLEPLRVPEYQMHLFGLPASVLTSIVLIIGGITIFAILLSGDLKEKNYWWKSLFKRAAPTEGEERENV